MAKKIIGILLLATALTGCSKETTTTKKDSTAQETTSISTSTDQEDDIDIDISEEMYTQWINEIYTNPDDYEGNVIRLQGAYMAEQDERNGNVYDYVYRQGPGCCGTDGAICGFEFTYDGIMPEDDEWIEVIGVLEQYEEDGTTYLNLKADSVRVKEDRENLILRQ